MTREVQAVVCDALADDTGSVSLRTLTLSDPGPGEIQVLLKACAVNFPDLLMIQGKYQFKPPLPFTPGGEAAMSALQSSPHPLRHCLSVHDWVITNKYIPS